VNSGSVNSAEAEGRTGMSCLHGDSEVKEKKAAFQCKKCGAVTGEEDHVCKPMEVEVGEQNKPTGQGQKEKDGKGDKAKKKKMKKDKKKKKKKDRKKDKKDKKKEKKSKKGKKRDKKRDKKKKKKKSGK
jgi:hypothetical protein